MELEITEVEKRPVFTDIKPGQYFLYSGKLYLKPEIVPLGPTEHRLVNANAVSVNDGCLCEFHIPKHKESEREPFIIVEIIKIKVQKCVQN